MIGFDLNEEQLLYQKLARTFAEEEMKPYAAELDRRQGSVFDWEIVRRFARANLLGLCVSKEYGGEGSTISPVPWSPKNWVRPAWGFLGRLEVPGWPPLALPW